MIDERIVLTWLVHNDKYTRKIIPYIKKEYFEDRVNQILFEIIDDFVAKHNDNPSKEALRIELLNVEKMTEEQYAEAEDRISGLILDPATNFDWVVGATEKFCQLRAMYLALTESFTVFTDHDKGNKNDARSLGEIEAIVKKALGVTFDSKLGHDFFADAEGRFDYYHLEEHKVPFDIKVLNDITKNGVSRKTLTILMAGVHVGKSAIMCHMAAANIKAGKKILYITLEMSEEMISQRVDANLMDLTIDQVEQIDKATFTQHIKRLRAMYGGDLRVKEYPTKGGGSGHFRRLLYDLKLKHNYVPDIIYIDYMNICCATTIKAAKVGLYEYVKTISEELRGLAVEFEVPIITATQFNRDGFKSSDPGMDDVSESFGTVATADLILGMVRNEELDKLNEILMIQFKNRYFDLSKLKHFVIGVNRSKMQFFQVDDERQNVSQDVPLQDKSLNRPDQGLELLNFDPETGEIFQ